MYSLSRTLTVRFSLTLFITLVLIALWVYLGTQRILSDQLDRSVWTSYQIESASLHSGRRIAQHVDLIDTTDFQSSVNRFVALRDSSGRILEVNTPSGTELPLDTAGFRQARAGDTAWATQPWVHGTLRSVFAPAADSGGGVVLQVAASPASMTEVGHTVLLLLFGTVVLGTAATMLGAGWLARVAVSPVDEIAQQAGSIDPGELGRRITVHADVVEFQSLIDVLNRMLERIDRGLESERRIIADVGHDLKTPITAMHGEIEVALRGTRAAADYRRVLESALEEVGHLEALSDALLLLARLEAGELRPQCEPTNLSRLTADVVQRLGRRADAHVVRRRGVGDETANVDAGMVGVVVAQLLDNAIKHTPAGTEVTVSVSSRNQAVDVVVEDTGPGLPAEVLLHIFERFYRGDPARVRGGAGLGLTISKAIAEAHGGTIVASRGASGGLRVTLTLPT